MCSYAKIWTCTSHKGIEPMQQGQGLSLSPPHPQWTASLALAFIEMRTGTQATSFRIRYSAASGRYVVAPPCSSKSHNAVPTGTFVIIAHILGALAPQCGEITKVFNRCTGVLKVLMPSVSSSSSRGAQGSLHLPASCHSRHPSPMSSYINTHMIILLLIGLAVIAAIRRHRAGRHVRKLCGPPCHSFLYGECHMLQSRRVS